MRTLAIIAASLFLIGVTTPLSAEPFSFQYQKILETSRPPS